LTDGHGGAAHVDEAIGRLQPDLKSSAKVYAGTNLFGAGGWIYTLNSYGATLPTGATEWIINSMFTAKIWTYDLNAIYLVILGAGIKESVATGFNMCADYCGYHS
jgi:hypothetical protein